MHDVIIGSRCDEAALAPKLESLWTQRVCRRASGRSSDRAARPDWPVATRFAFAVTPDTSSLSPTTNPVTSGDVVDARNINMRGYVTKRH